MSYKVKNAVEKEIDQEATVDGKTYPPPPVEDIGTLPKAKSKKRGSVPADSETDGGEPPVKSRVLLQSKGEGWKLKLPKHHKYRVVFVQEKADSRTCFELFAANEYSTTKDAFNSANKTLCPLLEDGCFTLSKELLKHILLPEPLPPECIGAQLIKVMEKEPGLHSEWQQLIQKLTAPKKAQSETEDKVSGLASLKRKLQKQQSVPDHPPNVRQNTLSSIQSDIGASTHLIAVPKVASVKVSDEEASDEVWTLFRRGTLRAKHDSNKVWLLEATEKQYVKSCIKLILSRVVNVNEKHPYTGDTALHIAIRSGNHTLVKLLLAYQADATILNKKKESPYDAAQKLKGASGAAIIGTLEEMKKLRIQAALHYSQNTKVPKKKGNSDLFLLSLDGGGMRSVIMCHILTAIENRMKELNSSCKPLQSYFDYIAGTSAGAIMGGLLLYADVPVPLSGMYLYNFMVEVFCCQKSDRIKKLKGFISELVGAEKVLSDINGESNIIVTTTLANVSPNQLHLMTSYGEPRDDQLGPDKRKVWEALVASAAAPTYFPSFGTFLDGGLMSNNPTLPAMTDIIRQGRKKSRIGCVLSLGTGFQDPPQRVDNFEVYVPGFSRDIFKNLYQSSMGLVSLLSHFVEQTTQSNGEVVREAETWCDSIGASYFRLSPPLKEEVPPDIKSLEKFVALLYETEVYILQQCVAIDSVAKVLLSK